MKLIVGLGNPLKKYNSTRHNVGFWLLDNILEKAEWKEKFSALYYEAIINNEKTLFIKPQTYMNLSGNAVIKFVNYFNININDILVIQDDIDMKFGKIKIKKSSSFGGHNGILSIINNLNSDDFYRLKIGVGNDHEIDAKDFVLDNFSNSEKKLLQKDLEKYKDIIDLFIKDDIESAMNKYN